MSEALVLSFAGPPPREERNARRHPPGGLQRP
jgi:hypothetical protein